MNKLVLLLVALLCASSLFVSASRQLESNDELREQRLRNLAETIAELQQEAQEQRNDNEPQRTFVQLGSDANSTSPSNSSSSSNSTSSSSSSNSTSSSTVSSSSNSTKSSNSSDEYHERKTPTLQGTNRADLVALYRFESKENPGRGFGGPGRNLHVFGKGIQIVTGDEAKRGKGSLFIPARPTSVPDKVDPTNPYQNSFLAKNSRGTPISGLPTGDDSFTVAAWYKVVPTKPGRYGVLSFGQLQRNQANLFQVTSNGRAVGSFKTGIPLKSNATRDTTSTWHHAAISWNRDTNMHTVYTDGVITAQRKLERAPDVSTSQFFLGVTANQPESEQFSGFLDDVAIFKVPLTQQEILNIKKGRFHPYLDLFSLRNCRTRLGRRQHGAGFVVGAADESISFNNSTRKYGYETKNAFACSVACARTTNCRQSVFLVNPSYADTNKTGTGNCYLQSVKYSTYEADKLATSTVCDRPSESLQKSSFLLKTSPDFDAQTAKRVKRVRKEKAAAEAKAKAEAAVKDAAEAKKIDEARKAEAKKVEAAKTAEQKATEKKARQAEAAKHAKEEEEHREAEKKKAEAREATRSAAQKAAKAAAKAEREAKLENKIESKYLEKITALKDALRAKEAKLKTQKAQASHRALVESERTTALISKLNSRLDKLSKKLAAKDEETKMLALASSIKSAADQKAAEIVAAAKTQVDKVRKQSRRTHRNRMRLDLEKKKRKSKKAKKAKKLTKAQKKAAKKRAAALKAMASADKAKAKASAAKLKRQLARAAKRKGKKSKKSKKTKPVSKSNPAQNGGMKF